MPKWGVLIVGLIALIVIITFLALRLRPANKITFPPCPDFTTQRLIIASKEITVALADSPAKRMHGLSSCPAIPENSGMYFILGKAHNTAFWMKDMLAPLDIVWVKDNVVTWVVPAAPIPSPGQSDDTLTKYTSPSPVDAVLELPAGQAQTHGIKIGTTIKPI